MSERRSRPQRPNYHVKEKRRSRSNPLRRPPTVAAALRAESRCDYSTTRAPTPPSPKSPRYLTDISFDLKPLTAYVQDPRRLLREAMESLGEERLESMIPPALKTMGRRNLEFFCNEELEKAGPELITEVLEGKQAANDTKTSDGSADTVELSESSRKHRKSTRDESNEDDDVWEDKLKETSKKASEENKERKSRGKKRKSEHHSRSSHKHKKKKHKKSKSHRPRTPSPEPLPVTAPPAKERSQMELVELEFRQKAILSLLRTQGEEDVSSQIDSVLSLKSLPVEEPTNIVLMPKQKVLDDQLTCSAIPATATTETEPTTIELDPPNELNRSHEHVAVNENESTPSPLETLFSSPAPVDVEVARDPMNESSFLEMMVMNDSISLEEGEVDQNFSEEDDEDLSVWTRGIASLYESKSDDSDSEKEERRSWAREKRQTQEDLDYEFYEEEDEQKALTRREEAHVIDEPNYHCSEDMSDVSLADLSIEDIQVDSDDEKEGKSMEEEQEKKEDDDVDMQDVSSESEKAEGVEFDELGVETESGSIIPANFKNDDSESGTTKLDDNGEEDTPPVTWYHRWYQSKKTQSVVKANKLYGSVRTAVRREDRKRKEYPSQASPLPPEPEVSIPIIGSIEEYESLFGKIEKPVIEEKNETETEDVQKSDTESDEDKELWGDIMGNGSGTKSE